METPSCKITLDRTNHTYYAGETIRGQITLTYLKPKNKLRCIYMKVIGHGKCSWQEVRREQPIVGQAGRVKQDVLPTSYSGQEDYLGSVVYIHGQSKGPPIELPEGVHTYDFQFFLNYQLPSTFKGAHGKIKYKLEFVIDKPWKFDEKYEIPIVVLKHLDIGNILERKIGQREQITKQMGIFGGGPLLVDVSLPCGAYLPTESMSVRVHVQNKSNIDVDKLRFTIRQVITYRSLVPKEVCKTEIVKLMRKEAPGVNKKTEQNYEHTLVVPEAPASDTGTNSRIIRIGYDIKVTASVYGLFKNVFVVVPIIIGSAAVDQHSGQYPPPPPFNPLLVQQQASFMCDSLYSVSGDSVGSSSIASGGVPPGYGFVLHESAPPSTPPSDYQLVFSTPRASGSMSQSFGSPFMNTSGGSGGAAAAAAFSSPNNSTRSSICSSSAAAAAWDAPPSYEEVFGSAPSNQNTPTHAASAAGDTNLPPSVRPRKH